MKNKVVIFDTDNSPFLNNNIFDLNVASKYPGAKSIYLFSQLCRKNGFNIVTADFAISQNLDLKDALIVTEIQSSYTNELCKRGAIKHSLICLETPSFSWKFYHNLKEISSKYLHSYLFRGTEKLVSKETQFHPMVFPQPDSSQVKINTINGWRERDFLVLLNSNQVRFLYKPLHIYASFLNKYLKEELYSLRRKAICYFSQFDDFKLYGRGWDKKLFGISNYEFNAALSVYKGSVDDKIRTLSNFKFSICFENATFGGYITEKIFDCFYAGCIPVYFGAIDVDQFIPKTCFIDFRDFNGFADLNSFLREIDESKFIEYQNSIQDFLDSDKFLIFSESYYAKKLFDNLNIITSE
jgi:hypothetical protein